MPRKRRDAPFGHNRACMQRQHSTLMTQDRPRRSKKKDLDILLRHPDLRPDADLPPLSNFEVRYVFYPDKGELNGMLNKFTRVFRNRGISRSDLDMNIGTLVNRHQRRNGSERDVGTYVPTTERITVAVSSPERCLLRQMKTPRWAPDYQMLKLFTIEYNR